jgi:hypothetical protein
MYMTSNHPAPTGGRGTLTSFHLASQDSKRKLTLFPIGLGSQLEPTCEGEGAAWGDWGGAG